jgi:3-isopropylmalate/(R)-2-methylmalate dehydratase small subunit
VARNNFGCGSSREHAVWAVQQYGFKAVIAPSKQQGTHRIPGFADIFRNNSGKNGLLTIELTEPEVEEIFQMVSRFPGLQATINLSEQRIILDLDEEIAFHFDIDPALKTRLLHGLDDIALTLAQEKEIHTFEKKHETQIAKV